jgi:hypothetical protein
MAITEAIGTGIRNVDGVETLFQWDENFTMEDIPWDDDLANQVREDTAALMRGEIPTQPEE